MIVLAVKTDPKVGAKGVALLIVDLRDCPGFAVGRVLDKVGQHGATRRSCRSPMCGCRCRICSGRRGRVLGS